MSNKSISFSKEIGINYHCDVLVVGGGISGVSAAVAASREGVKVALIEKFAVLGGNLTAGGVAAFCGETKGQGRVFDEILFRLEAFNAIDEYQPYKAKELGEARTCNHNILGFVLQEMLVESHVDLFLHTSFVAVDKNDNFINNIIILGKGGLEAISCKVIIDATGDGDVGYNAGFSTFKGNENTGDLLPMSMIFYTKYLDTEFYGTEIPEGYFEKITDEKDLPMVSLWVNGDHGRAIKVKIPKFDATNTMSLAQAEIFARKRCMQILDFIESKKNPLLWDHTGMRNGKLSFEKGRYQRQSGTMKFDGFAGQIAIREGRRIEGDYVLTFEDVISKAEFPDAIARGTFYLDAHSSKNDKRTYVVDEEKMYTDPYQIPLRSIIAKDGKNLLIVGRCFSCEQLALSTARVTTTCSMLGQAAGVLAGVSVKKNCTVRETDPVLVRTKIEDYGAILDIDYNFFEHC